MLEIHPYRAGLDDVPCRARGVFRAIAISRLHVRRDRNLDRRSNAPAHRHHFPARDMLPVRISQAKRDTRAGCGYRAEAALLKHTRAGRIPGIGQQKNVRTSMPSAERVCLCLLLGPIQEEPRGTAKLGGRTLSPTM